MTRGTHQAWFAAASAMLVLVLGFAARAADRVQVRFEIVQTTVLGQSVYVLGDLPELGGNDVRRAVKLEPGAYPTWGATISLPAGRVYSYRYYLRADAPSQQGLASNGTPIGALRFGGTGPVAPGVSPATKTFFVHSAWPEAHLNWRFAGTGAFTQAPLERFGPGNAPGQTRFFGWGFAPAGREVEFFFTRPGTTQRDPASGVYTTSLDAVLVQGGQIYTYVPASAPASARRDYNPSNPPTIQSANLLGETRRYRVFLPRGYDVHRARRYPVLYMHDGQNVFEVGPFGSWNAATTLTTLQRTGAAREIIIVAVDNGPNRLSDYAAPDAGGWADRYARFLRDELKPRIDAQYRTLPGAATTGAMGSSMGGQVSLYLGWDFTSTFTRVGAMSGAFQVFSSGFYNRVRAQPVRAIRLWLDSGDTGPSSDNYWPIYNLRDNLLSPARAGGSAMALSGDLMHRVGLGQQHNEAAWAARLPEAITFLYPAREDQGDLLALFNPLFDVDASGAVDKADLAKLRLDPRDITLDGRADEGDVKALEAFLERDPTGPRARGK